jgi:P-type conjugative transfer protein TrbJ
MKKHHLSAFAGATLSMTPIVLLGFAAPANAIIVFDPTNYAKNLLTAQRALTQINNQIRSLQNEATMLSNEARNLTTVGFPELQQITADLQQIDRLMAQARGISFRIADLSAQYARLFPGEGRTGVTADQRIVDARARLDSVMAAYRETMAAQSQVAGNVSADAPTLALLAARSQGAEGALQVAQTSNQLLALTTKQQFQIQQMMATQYRAEATEAEARAQSAIDGRAATIRFLGSGSAYTPQ